MSRLLGKRTIDVPCTIEIENTFESLHAHVELHDGLEVEAGDEVLVHGDPIRVPYGQKVTLQRMATVTRASRLQRACDDARGPPRADRTLRSQFFVGKKAMTIETLGHRPQ